MESGVISSLLSHPVADGLLVLDREGRCLLANPAARSRGLDRIVERHAHALAGHRHRLQAGTPQALDCELPAGDGCLSACLRVIAADEGGAPVAFSLSVRLPSDDAEWLQAADAGGHALWVWDVRRDRLRRSEAWEERLGATSGTDTFEDALQSIHPDDRQRAREAMDACLAGRLPVYQCEYRRLHDDGSWRWLRDSGRVIHTASDGAPICIAGTLTGIDSQKQLEQRLREQRGMLEDAQRLAGMASWTWDVISDVVWAAPELRDTLAIDNGVRVRAWVRHCRANATALREAWRAMRRGEDRVGFDLEAPGRAGVVHLRVWASQHCDDRGRPTRVLAQIQDVTRQIRAEHEWRRGSDLLRRVAELGRIGGCEIDPATRVLYWTGECARLHGHEDGTLALDELLRHYTPESRDALQAAMVRGADGAPAEALELCFYRPDGQQVWTHAVIDFERQASGIGRHLVLFRDITGERAANERIRRLSHYDPLTGLPNRLCLREEVEQAFAEGPSAGQALLLLDLDGFGGINEAHGPAAGDAILRAVAARLHILVEAGDLFGRLGGDEFAILIRRQEGRGAVEAYARRIVADLSGPVPVGEELLHLGVAAGIAIRPENVGFDDLLRGATAALHIAKQGGRNRIEFHSIEAWHRARRRLHLEQALRGALEREEMSLVYQPQIDLARQRISGVEALVRWEHPRLGGCLPEEFVPIAEMSGDIAAIGDWVLREACRQASAWAAAGIAFGRMSVNVSAVQLRDAGFAASVLSACTEAEWPPSRLEIELTESALLRDTESLRECFQVLTAAGVALAIDDFGTGFSSLSYLSRFPVGRLKIDRSFISGIGEGERATEVARAIIQLGKALRMQVLAEGVESADDERLLIDGGCDEAQGYLYSRPLAARDMARWLMAHGAPGGAPSLANVRHG